jgi:hypothetical protein
MVTDEITVTLDPRLCAARFRGFYLFGSLAAMTTDENGLRPIALRPKFSLRLPLSVVVTSWP